MEMLKLILARHAVPALAVMTETGLLQAVLGGVPLLASFSNMIKLEAALALAGDPVRRLGALAVSVVEDAERLRVRLRLTNAEHERLCSMADGWWQIAPTGDEHRASRSVVGAVGAVLLDASAELAEAHDRDLVEQALGFQVLDLREHGLPQLVHAGRG